MSAHKIFRTSLISFCQASIVGMATAGIVAQGQVQFIDFDAHASLAKLPDGDLLGIANFHWINEERFYVVGAHIGIATWKDTNNFRHNDIADWLTPLLLPLAQIPVIDPDTGLAMDDFMVVEEGVTLTPFMHTDIRGLQFFIVSFRSSLTA
jgi:hypothetical protein